MTLLLPVNMEKFGPLPERPHPRAVVPIPRIAFLVDIKADACAALAANGPDSPEGQNWQGLADELRDVVWMLRAVQSSSRVESAVIRHFYDDEGESLSGGRYVRCKFCRAGGSVGGTLPTGYQHTLTCWVPAFLADLAAAGR